MHRRWRSCAPAWRADEIFEAGCSFREYLMGETRYAALTRTFPDIADELFAKAEELINGALTNPETKDQAETWNVAGFIQKRRSEKEMENAYLRKPYDTLQLYNSA